MLARTLGYKSAERMLADLTPDEYERWRLSYDQNPWGEAREDQRNMATVLWMLWTPEYEGETREKLPDLNFPYWKTEAEKQEAAKEKVSYEVAEYQKLKARAAEDAAKLKAKRKASGN